MIISIQKTCRLFFLVFTLSSNFSFAQNISSVKNTVYNEIIKDLSEKGKTENAKIIYLDASQYQFKTIKLGYFGLELDSVEIKKDNHLCNINKPNVSCKNRFDIDQFSLNLIYKAENDKEYPIFFGVYSPLDYWYNLFYYMNVVNIENKRNFIFQEHIPVIYKYIDQNKQKEIVLFYSFTFNDQFEIIDMKVK